MHRKLTLLLLMAGLTSGLSLPVRAAGDVTAGGDLFDQECGECHSLKQGKNKKGPSLFGISGRKAASIAEFTGYSDALKASNLSWSNDNLSAYMKAPKTLVPGGKMKYDGLPDEKGRSDIIAFLATIH